MIRFETFDVHGFPGLRFNDRYGHACSVQQSSLATDDAIWFGIDDAKPEILASQAAAHGVQTTETAGWVPYPIPDAVSLHTRMHLTRNQMRDLLPILQRFVDDGIIEPPNREAGAP